LLKKVNVQNQAAMVASSARSHFKERKGKPLAKNKEGRALARPMHSLTTDN